MRAHVSASGGWSGGTPKRCSARTQQVALAYTASILVGLAAQQAGRPDLIRSPKRVLAHSWEGLLAR